MSLLSIKALNLFRNNAIIGPAAILFVSANIANAANLLFNMVFARLMGPALFADLTLLLTLKLGVLSFLGALQFAYSERTAKRNNVRLSKVKAHAISWHSLKYSVPVMFIVIASANFLSSALNFSSPLSLSLLALAIPFFLPMIIYRGLTQGLIDVPKIVLSIQAEWILRLFGGFLLWTLGFGLPGIAVAVGLSIFAGFIVSLDKNDLDLRKAARATKVTPEAKAVGTLALPYLILQLAQVIVLDSDIVIAKAVFPAETAGLVAGLLLIQRVFFFAFLSCSAILQPYVAKQKTQHKSANELFALLMAIAFISIVALIVIIPNSERVVELMLGRDYTPLASILWISALTGAVFIVSHLCAIYQIAKGQKLAAILVLGFGFAQLLSLSAVNYLFPEIGLQLYFSIKLAIQSVCAVCLLGTVMLSQKKRSKR